MAPEDAPAPPGRGLPAFRREVILEMLQARGFVTTGELVATLHVSEPTVRRDIDSLARVGRAARVHGGAILLSPLPRARVRAVPAAGSGHRAPPSAMDEFLALARQHAEAAFARYQEDDIPRAALLAQLAVAYTSMAAQTDRRRPN